MASKGAGLHALDRAGQSLPDVRVPPPGPQSRALSSRLAAVECPSVEARRQGRTEESGEDQSQIVYARGEGANVVDVDGNLYVDLAAAFGALLLGHKPAGPAAAIDEYAPDLVVLSPGPGRPADFGCAALLSELEARRLAVFGVCLGLQALVEQAGGELSLLAQPAHGKPGQVVQTGAEGSRLLAGLPAEFTAARYHSLYAVPEQVKGGYQVTAVTPDGVVMAIEDDAAGRWAVQFHPESILTASGRAGHQVIGNVLRLCQARRAEPARVDVGQPG